VLYELLTRKHPFRRDTPAATLGAVVETEPKPPGEVAPGLPRDLEKIVQRCLRKDPEKRFQSMGDVELELEEVAAELDGPPAVPVAPARRRWPWALGGGAVVLLLALVLAAVLRFGSAQAPPPRLVQLTTLPGVERRPAFSPDGQQLAFAWGGDASDNLDVYVMSVAGGSPLRLTSDPSEEDFPAWSPDGRRIAFRRLAGSLASLHVVSSLGGPVTKVADLGPVGDHGVPYPSLAWTPDGRSLVAAHRGPDGGTLLLVPVEQGERRLLLTNDGRLVCPTVSPDGRLLAYGACLRPWVCDLFVSALGPDGLEGSPRRVTPQSVNNLAGLSWSRDGRTLFYSNFGGVPARLWRVPVSGSTPPEVLELPGTGAHDPAASRASDRLAFSREYLGDEDIWILERGQAARPLLAHTAMDAFPEFSPDGRRLAFSSGRSGDRVAIHVAGADGSNPVALTSGAGGGQGSPAWSPDGRRIAFDAGRPDSSTAVIFVVDSDGGAARQLTESRADDFCPAWSRDGRWVYFSSNRSGRFEIWRAPSEGGDATQVTDTGGVRPVVSPDGRTLYYLRQEFRSPLLARPVAGGEERQVVDSVTRMQYVVREDGLYYFSPVGGGSHATLPWGTVIDRGDVLRFLDFATGHSRDLATVHNLGRGLTVSPDGETILYTVRKPPNADLMLIENFR
jgi:eukaryotic-like serine/threonine-protein kinase